MYFIDSSIFLELYLMQDKWEDCEVLFQKIADSKLTAACSDFLIYSSIIVMETRAKEIERIKKFLVMIENLGGLRIIRPGLEEWKNATKTMKEENLDFDDALVISCMKANNIRDLISFDRHFDKVKEIRRIEPRGVL
ncbi:MAG TPA: type II toxin-antitoxin system VapC family toxin [Nanoarchaeota archaeon]|nr:MAG: hypothetical protein QT01_C0005G0048 [archaeon GW2011_AR6]MBS3082635.1 type II toxin-antitoxin system VapC family toxin [Candidatus Pacearchaeota archaeon]HIH17426.1 type II toxin-antitoxin system VapC family toxin [Nanoarchaeota archaeon]HIH34354.1 type II toxin-antitoxin system VapC family toxin [Nanoarchaeota archaeon]HIH51880.1 type II toxin-antitoxin system VapC family toxin [Nanoarchaeota archaeon]